MKPRLISILKDNISSATQQFGDNLKDKMKSVNEKVVALTVDHVDRPKHFRPHFLSRRGEPDASAPQPGPTIQVKQQEPRETQLQEQGTTSIQEVSWVKVLSKEK